MTQRLVGEFVVVVVLTVSISQTVLATGTQVPFDRVYTVGGPGSTTPLNQFDINGPAPCVYLDLLRGRPVFVRVEQLVRGIEHRRSIPSLQPVHFLESRRILAFATGRCVGTDQVGRAVARRCELWMVGFGHHLWQRLAPVTKTFGNQRVDFSVKTADANGDGRVDVSDLIALGDQLRSPRRLVGRRLQPRRHGGCVGPGHSRDPLGDGTDGSGPSLEASR